jgi:hypothetical protein
MDQRKFIASRFYLWLDGSHVCVDSGFYAQHKNPESHCTYTAEDSGKLGNKISLSALLLPAGLNHGPGGNAPIVRTGEPDRCHWRESIS